MGSSIETGESAGVAGKAAHSSAGKHLTFKLGAENFGVEILKVQEIIKMMEITKVPRTPSFVKGVINLRGKVIPVIDLRMKFGMPEIEATEKTCVIVVQVKSNAGGVIMGIIVDEVSEVLDIAANQIEAPPEFGTSVDTAFLLGMAKVGERVIMLIDVDGVLSPSELNAISAA